MGTVIQSIGTAGGRNFSTVQAWEDALPANLITDGNSYIGQCYKDSEFAVAGTVLTISGETTDATHTITLTCGPNQSFRDFPGAGFNPLRYDATKGVGLRKTVNYNAVILVGVSNVFLDGLQIKNDQTNGGGASINTAIDTTGFTCTIQNCIVQTVASHGFRSGGGNGITMTVKNTLLIVGNGASVGVNHNASSGTGANLKCYNCTIVEVSDSVSTTVAVFSQYNYGTQVLENCAIFGFSAVLGGSTPVARFAGSSYNASDKTFTFSGPSNKPSLTYSNQFVNTTGAAADFRTKTGADLVDAGFPDTTNIPTADDIIRQSRPQGLQWDIGVWELPVDILMPQMVM